MTPEPVAIDLGEDRAVSGLWMKPEDAAAPSGQLATVK